MIFFDRIFSEQCSLSTKGRSLIKSCLARTSGDQEDGVESRNKGSGLDLFADRLLAQLSRQVSDPYYVGVRDIVLFNYASLLLF